MRSLRRYPESEQNRGRDQARQIQGDAGLLADGRTFGRGSEGRPVASAALRHPEARRQPPAFRPSARIRGDFPLLGRTQGAFARPQGSPDGNGGRGSPARLRGLRGHHPQGTIWRRHGHVVGPGLLGAGEGFREHRPGPRQGRAEVRHGRRTDAWLLGAGAHQARQPGQGQLAPDQAPRPGRRGRESDGPDRRRPLRRIRPHHDGNRQRQGQGGHPFHDRQGRAGGIGVAEQPRRQRAGRPDRARQGEGFVGQGQDRVEPARLHRAAADQVAREAAFGSWLGARDQVRRLPDATAHRRR